MKNQYGYKLVVCLIVAIPLSANAADKKATKAKVAGLVQSLGYGGAIHNFKNYVLRGDEKYGLAAGKMFDQTNQLLKEIAKSGTLSKAEKKSLAVIGKLVKAYQGHLATVKKLHKQGKSVEAIDEAVSVDDAAAIKAVAKLRKGHQWSNIEELDFHIGYGSGIHSFKNFVLRADESYRARASLGLSKVLLIVARYRLKKGVTKQQMNALGSIASVVQTYQKALPKVENLVGKGNTAKEIDKAVRIDDSPAFKGLAVLRKSNR